MRRLLISTLIMAFVLSISGVVFGAPAEVAESSDTEKEIKTLKERIAKLENTANTKTSAAAPKVTFSGDSRIRWIDKHNGDTTTDQRVRLGMKADVNNDISFYGRFMLLNNNEMGTTGTNDKVQFIDANFTHKGLLGFNSVTFGRFSQDFLATKFWASTNGRIDGVRANFGNKVNVNVGFGNWAPASKSVEVNPATGAWTLKSQNLREAVWLDAEYELNKDTKLYGMWLKETMSKDTNASIKDNFDFNVIGFGIDTKIAPNLKFIGDYTNNRGVSTQGVGYYLTLQFREVNKSVPGSWNVKAEYRYVEKFNNVPSITGVNNAVTDVKGPDIRFDYVPAKNYTVRGTQTFNSKTASTGISAADYTRVEFIYNF